MVSVLASNVLDRGFQPWSGQTKDYAICICCFSGKHATLKRKSKDWLSRNHDNVSELGDMSASRLLFQCASTIQIQQRVLVWYKMNLIIISLKINLFSPKNSWTTAKLVSNNNHSLTQYKCFEYILHSHNKIYIPLNCSSLIPSDMSMENFFFLKLTIWNIDIHTFLNSTFWTAQISKSQKEQYIIIRVLNRALTVANNRFTSFAPRR